MSYTIPMSLWNTFISFIFPETCILCRNEGSVLCEQCLEYLPLFPHSPHDFIYPLFSYQDKKVRTVIHALKYNHAHSIIPIITPILHEIVQDILMHSITLSSGQIYIIPVPDMKKHTRARGTNHVRKIAKSLQQCNPSNYILLDSCIIRINTTSQRDLSRKDRLTNMYDGFKVIDSNTLINKNILIIDDVCTTGSTLMSLRKECLNAGARKVIALVLAH